MLCNVYIIIVCKLIIIRKGSGHVLSNHIAVNGCSCKTFRPRRSSSVTVLKKREVIGLNIYSNHDVIKGGGGR